MPSSAMEPTSNGIDSPTGQRPQITGAVLPPGGPKHDPYAAFRSRGYALFTTGNLVSIIGRQMLAVAVEWEIYQRTHSATALGLVGLVIAIPVVGLSLPAGHLADRFSRKRIISISQILSSLVSLLLALVSWKHLAIPNASILRASNHGLNSVAAVFERHAPGFHFDDASIPVIYFLLFVYGSVRTFGWAARSSFFPTLVPRDAFSNAVTWNSSVFQIGSVLGPGVGGLVIARAGFPCVYIIDAIGAFLFFLLILPVPREKRSGERAERNAWRSLVAGMRFVFSKDVILATITLDLFAVLLGGATALLPMFADQILHCGPVGLGWMRAAPAIGAFGVALAVAYFPPMRQAGKTLLYCVSAFGIATIVFGLSKMFWLSIAMLFLIGGFDSVSVIIRGSILQLVTPDNMRGRVSAVNNIFIGTSNEFGALESGLTAALFGPVLSVVAGGMGTILAVMAAAWKWPEIRRIGALDKTLK